MIKKLATILLLLSTCLQAELTTANILPQIAASLNAYPYLQATLTEIYSAAGDIDAAPEPDSLTANYYFARDDAYAEVQRDSRVEVITQNSYYLDLNGVKQLAGSLDDFLRSKMLPGFESYILRGLDAVTFNQLADGRLLITASAVASRDYDLAVLTVSHDILEKIEFYQTLTAEQLLLRRTLYLRYATQGGYWYLQRAAWNNGSPALMIREFTNVKYVSLGDIDLHNDGYDAPPGDGGDDFDEDDPSWPIGGQVKFEEGSKLTPFAAYGVAGEEVPGSSGALQLGYTDLSLPGINGLDLVIRRSYVSQQFLANPKPNSFSENPFNLRYRTKKFLDEYHLILPDGWGGWMGLGWQTSIGGELYVNEVDMFMLSGPYAGPPEMSKIQTMTVRNYTMQTADGYRADFGQEFEDDITGSEAEGAAFSFFTAPLALIARNTDFMDAKKMFELRDYLQRTDKLESPSNVLKSKDPRSKMKVSIEDGGETYVVYLPDGKKYYFRQKVFDKEAEYYTDSYNSAIFGVNRGFMGMQYRSKVYYLTQIADVNDNQIEIIYEKLFEEKSNKVSNKTLDYYAQIDSAAFVNTVLDLYTAIPASEIKDGMDTAKFMVSLNNMINDGTSAGGMAYSLFDEDARNNFTMSKFATGLLTGVVKKILVKFIASFLALIPPGIFLREIAAVGLAAIMSLSAEDTTYSYEARYEIQGHRPVQIVDTLKRRVDLHYRSG
ncbi:MAG: hypothetical protein LBK68_00330, partial [Candidatus Margulisbacteria bacterium]|nr:hypothetical protein [Candidatus Margulisiibacteriota bacterium]